MLPLAYSSIPSLVLCFWSFLSGPTKSEQVTPIETLKGRAAEIVAESSKLSDDRKTVLAPMAEYISQKLRSEREVEILFVCTHNSRRSQFSQFWVTVAADYYQLKHVHVASCGTTETACNPRTVASLRRFGVSVVKTSEGDNPTYLAQFSDDSPPVKLFSKALGHPSLPKGEFLAAFCCDDADKVCPHVPNAAVRVPLHYVDPKVHDDQPREPVAYDERSLQIAAEMFYVMRRAKELAR
jgi:arsenate reductase (thioredoxin)